MKRIAIVGDIHGNLAALEAVLADIAERRVDRIVDLGDVAQGSLQPAAVIDRLRQAGVASIRGNADRLLLASSPPPGYEADYCLARAEMSAADVEWLGSQPDFRVIDDVYLCHGTPSSDTTGLLETIEAGGARVGSDREIAARLGNVGLASLIAVGHTHVPRSVRLVDGRLCINPGSVGLPAYEDDQPFPHVMEAGSPHARYAIIDRPGAAWRVEHVAIAYDWEGAAAVAEARGRPDRAFWLRTGRSRPKVVP